MRLTNKGFQNLESCNDGFWQAPSLPKIIWNLTLSFSETSDETLMILIKDESSENVEKVDKVPSPSKNADNIIARKSS